MREFAITFERGLRKGLRAFKNPIPGQEELLECYNLVPSEQGLLPYEPIAEVDFSNVISELPSHLDDIRAYWKLDEAAGGPYADSLGISPMVGLQDNATDDLRSVTGKIQNCARAIQTNAQQGYGSEGAYSTDNSQFTLTDYTINMWFRYNPANSFSYWILRKTETVPLAWSDPVLKEWGIWHRGTADGARAIIFYRGDGGANWTDSVICTFTNRANVWFMLTITYNSSSQVLRVRLSNATDGFAAFDVSSPGTFPVLVDTNQPIVLGNFYDLSEGSVNFDYDEIGIWGRVLTTNEVTALWNSGNGLSFPFLA